MVGYHLHPGGRWSGDYSVHRLSDLAVPFRDMSMSTLHVHRTREVFHLLHKPFVFPLRARHDEEAFEPALAPTTSLGGPQLGCSAHCRGVRGQA
jgi:hypothetical protein